MKKKKEISKKPLLQVQPPCVPCDQCIENHGKIFLDEIVLTYCCHNLSGAIHDIAAQQWIVFHPITDKEFFKEVLRYGFALLKLLRKRELDGNSIFH